MGKLSKGMREMMAATPPPSSASYVAYLRPNCDKTGKVSIPNSLVLVSCDAEDFWEEENRVLAVCCWRHLHLLGLGYRRSLNPPPPFPLDPTQQGHRTGSVAPYSLSLWVTTRRTILRL